MASPGLLDRRPRILVVEDEAGVRKILDRGLRKHFDLVLATNGRDALDIVAKDKKFDLVLTDLRMPKLDGFGLHRELMISDRELAARTVFMSGSTADPDLAAQLARLGVSAVTKPFVVADLARKLAEIVDAIGLNEAANR